MNQATELHYAIMALQSTVAGLEGSLRTNQYLDLSEAVRGLVGSYSKQEHMMHNMATLNRYHKLVQDHPALRVSEYLLDELEALDRAPLVFIGEFANGDSTLESANEYQRQANREGQNEQEPF